MTGGLGEAEGLAAPHQPGVELQNSGGLIRRGVWAVADQGLFAGSNFILQLFLANWLTERTYGDFATAMAVFLLLGVIHTALLTEPMLVFAPGRYKNSIAQYLGALIPGHIIVSILASLSIAGYGIFWRYEGQNELANAMYCFAAAAPFILFLWLMRRACYARFQPRRAAIAGVGYLVLMMSALIVVHVLGVLSIATALAMVGGSSMVAGIWLARGLVTLGGVSRPLLKDVLVEHWRYGRWATATQLMGYLPANIYYFLFPKIASVEQSAALMALSNLFKPFVQANAALCLLLLPAFVRTQNTPQGKRVHRLALMALAGGPLVYWLILGLAHRQVIAWVYHGKFQEYSGLLWVIGLQPVILGMSGIYGSLLRARQKMNAVFWGGFVAAAAAVALGTPMAIKFGMTGVCWSIVLATVLHHITLWLFSLEFTRHSDSVVKLSPEAAEIAAEAQETTSDASMS